jgi:hypothetical protein
MENRPQLVSNWVDNRGFRRRLRWCIALVGSRYALAKASRISATSLKRYLTGSEPTRPFLIAVAVAAGVKVEWLATGEEPKFASHQKSQLT